MQRLTKDILTTKITKATKDSDIFDYELRTRLENLRGLGKSSNIRSISDSDISPAKAPRTLSSDKYFFFFFAAFASLREIVRDSVAASPRWAPRVLRGQVCSSSALCWLRPRRAGFSIIKLARFLGGVLFAGLMFPASSSALEIPALRVPINDFAKMMPPPSIDDLTERLRRIRSETGYNIVVLTVQSLEGEDIANFGSRAFEKLPLTDKELQRSVLLIVARKEQKVAVQAGAELRPLFPEPAASRKLQTQVEIYFNGMRPDLGIHGGVHYIYGVIQGDFRLDRTSEEEKLENISTRGAGAGAIFAVFLAPFLAFFVGVLWGVYATHYGVQRELRLFIGAVLGGGTAKLVAMLMAMIGGISDGLWYFILALSVPLAVFGSLTEYWMGGDWRGIPRVKNSVKRKPEDNMGI